MRPVSRYKITFIKNYYVMKSLFFLGPVPRPLLAMALALTAAGCGVTSGPPVPVEDRGRVPQAPAPKERADTRPGPGRAEGPAEVVTIAVPSEQQAPPGSAAPAPHSAPASATPAVVALLAEAKQAEQRGDLEVSEASLERAIRIESRNPWIWHRLALIKLFRKDYGEAVAMAERSNALAAGRPDLQRDNWRLIAQAEEARGRSEEARAAAARARRFESR